MTTINPGQNYVVTDATDDKSPVYSFVDGSDVLAILDSAHRNNLKIKVQPLGEPVIDWTK